MRWHSRQSTFKVGKRKTEVRWFSIRIFPFVKLGIGSGAYPQGAPAGAAGGRRSSSKGHNTAYPRDPEMGPRLLGGYMGVVGRPDGAVGGHDSKRNAHFPRFFSGRLAEVDHRLGHPESYILSARQIEHV